jgi:PKHD-type hydroxylase
MNLKNYYYYFQSVIPHHVCDEIIKLALSKKEEQALTGGSTSVKSKEELYNLKLKRNSNIVWLNDSWIYNEIRPYIQEANKLAGWNFEWDYSEECQFTKYKLNQYYDWHCDSWDEPYNLPNTPSHGKVRKLSMTLQLTDGSEYEGGELEFDFRQYAPVLRDESKHLVKCKEILPKGSMIVFPSFVWHRVKPVTSGTRYSLVCWNLGYPFK